MFGFAPGKTKRRDFEDVYDDFADFSLSSPARKIRRLDAEFPPIVEETIFRSPATIHELPQEQVVETASAIVEPFPAYSANEERAIVLYKPVENPLILSPAQPDFAFHVSSDLIHNFKNHVLKNKERDSVPDNSLAVVPWVAPQATVSISDLDGVEVESQIETADESMEAEEAEATSMEVEDCEEVGGNSVVAGGGLQFQQHCMVPQHLPSASSPVMWSW